MTLLHEVLIAVEIYVMSNSLRYHRTMVLHALKGARDIEPTARMGSGVAQVPWRFVEVRMGGENFRINEA